MQTRPPLLPSEIFVTGYDLADLEQHILEQGWTVAAQDFVTEQDVPGQVDKGGYDIRLTDPAGESYSGTGSTRSDALREAAGRAGLLPGEGVTLI
jgi:hypothetical protein